MAKYTVAAGCGHTTTIELYGPDKERTRRIEWMKSTTGKCNPCYAQSKRSEEAPQRETEIVGIVAQLESLLETQADKDAALAKLRTSFDAMTTTGVRLEAGKRFFATHA